MQEIATIPQDAASLHYRVAGHLLHPWFVRVNGDPGDIRPGALKMDEKQHVVGHQPAQGQHLCGEEVGPRQQRQVVDLAKSMMASGGLCMMRPGNRYARERGIGRTLGELVDSKRFFAACRAATHFGLAGSARAAFTRLYSR
jgi:hypothetical protein